jgi:hypothetical protein
MDAKERFRFENLQRPCVNLEFLRETYGVDWPPDEQFAQDFGAWHATRVNPCGDRTVNRYAFELFLLSQRLMTRSYAAARLGMTTESLARLLPELPKIGLSKKYAVYKGIVDESLSDDLVRSLKGLRFRTFGSHDFFCEFLHEALKSELGLPVNPLFCDTADRLGEQRMYASTWDNITLLPLSTKHSVWLSFNKPISLAPDRCSKLFYAEHHDELRPFIAGREEPRDLQRYLGLARRPA